MVLIQLYNEDLLGLDLWLSTNHAGGRRDELRRPTTWAALLAAVPLFNGLEAGHLDLVAALLQPVRTGPRALLLERAADATCLFILDEGECVVEGFALEGGEGEALPASSYHDTAARLVPGDFFGLASLLALREGASRDALGRSSIAAGLVRGAARVRAGPQGALLATLAADDLASLALTNADLRLGLEQARAWAA